MGTVLNFRPNPAATAVADACRWHEAVEQITSSNLRIACAWQRVILRAVWGM